MFALRSSLQQSAALARRRFASAAAPKSPLVPEVYNYTFQKAFMSDPGTYPLIIVMTVATGLVLGVSIDALCYYKGWTILPSRKHEIIPTWGTEHSEPWLKILIENPHTPFWTQAFKDIRQEGLGVNHEEWKKSKGLE